MDERSPVAIESHAHVYDTIGHAYSQYRRPDERIAEQIRRALGDARTICNIGAGTGSYEPSDRTVVAVEPSSTMCQQRSSGAIRAVAEALPFRDHAFDAVTGFLTIHHWRHIDSGLAEARRVAPRRVFLVFDFALHADLWLVRDYLPEVGVVDRRAPTVLEVATGVAATRVETVSVPWDCSDGFLCAYWRRPEMYLNPDVRACISGIAQLEPSIVERAMAKLRRDLHDGTWLERNGNLVERESMDYGYRLVISD